MTIQPNDLNPVSPPADHVPSVVTKEEVPMRLRVLSEASGIPASELIQMPNDRIWDLVRTFEGNLDVAAQKVLAADQGGPGTSEPAGGLNLPASQAELQDRIDKAYQWLSHKYAYHAYLGGAFDYEKEYAAYPLAIVTPNSPVERMLGQSGYSPYTQTVEPFGRISNVSIGQSYCFMDVSFEDGNDFDYGEPLMWADRYYSTTNNGQVQYSLSVRSYGGTQQVDLYRCNELGQSELLLADLKNQSLPQSFSWYHQWGSAWPAGRYTIRHAAMTTGKAYKANNDGRGDWLLYLGNSFGFYNDLYDPMFGVQYPFDRWCFDPDAYHDCDVYGQLPKNLNDAEKGLYYPYRSKVCDARGSCGLPGTYIWLSQRDRLVRIVQAIHILLKYGNPDYSYLDPKDDGSYTTPRAVARDMEANCWAGGGSPGGGYGINTWGQDSSYASGIRTNAFLVLETLLGYKYGDSTSRAFADRTADVLIQVQWGSPPFNPWQGETSEHGILTRGQYQGGQLLGWKPGSGFQWSLPPKTWLRDFIDSFGMASEDEDFIPSNTESTASYLQALRVYLRYKYGVYYPTSQYFP